MTDHDLHWIAQRQLLADLYVAARSGVLRSLLAAGVDPARAQEATQESFLRLYVVLREGAPVENPRGVGYRWISLRSEPGRDQYHAAVVHNGQTTDLGAFSATATSIAGPINNKGQMGGYSTFEAFDVTNPAQLLMNAPFFYEGTAMSHGQATDRGDRR